MYGCPVFYETPPLAVAVATATEVAVFGTDDRVDAVWLLVTATTTGGSIEFRYWVLIIGSCLPATVKLTLGNCAKCVWETTIGIRGCIGVTTCTARPFVPTPSAPFKAIPLFRRAIFPFGGRMFTSAPPGNRADSVELTTADPTPGPVLDGVLTAVAAPTNNLAVDVGGFLGCCCTSNAILGGNRMLWLLKSESIGKITDEESVAWSRDVRGILLTRLMHFVPCCSPLSDIFSLVVIVVAVDALLVTIICDAETPDTDECDWCCGCWVATIEAEIIDGSWKSFGFRQMPFLPAWTICTCGREAEAFKFNGIPELMVVAVVNGVADKILFSLVV